VTTPTIAVFTKNRTNPAYAAARLGADRTCARLGARATHYVPQRPDDVDEQIALVGQAIATRPDAIVFTPVHETAVNDAVAQINAAGIPIFNIINRMSAGVRVTFVGSDDRRLAREVAEWLFRHLGGRGEVVVLEGVPEAVTSRDRMLGFDDAAREYPGIRIAGSRVGAYQHDAAVRAMRELLELAPVVDGVLAANDVMALGALEALEAAGRRAAVVGVNALPEAVAALKSGRMLATVDFDALKMCAIATEAAIRHLRGETVPPEIELPVEIVHADNCQPWDRPLEARDCPDWSSVITRQRTAS